MSWNVQDPIDKLDKYEWEASSDERDQVLTDTVAPGDLNVRPADFDIVPTLAPATTGIQSGVWKWSYTNVPDSSWYVRGSIVEE